MKTKEKIKELRNYISNMNSFHFNQIHNILDKKEEGEVDINLDILSKIHENGHSECVKIIKLIDKLFPEEKTK